MANDENVELEDLELEDDDEGGEGEDKSKKSEKDEKEKPKLTPEQIKGIKQRNLTKLAKELGVELSKPDSVRKEEKAEKKGFDYAEKAYLKASGIESEHYDFVKEVMDSTGKSLDDVLEAKYFQSELKERRDAKAAKDAIPSGSKRSSSSARDEVGYWIKKGELPPADQRELRQQVVNARIKSEGSKDVFTSRSVVGG